MENSLCAWQFFFVAVIIYPIFARNADNETFFIDSETEEKYFETTLKHLQAHFSCAELKATRCVAKSIFFISTLQVSEGLRYR